MDDEALNAIVEETLNRAGQNFTKVGTLPSILSEADQRLSERLHKVVDRRGGAEVRFSEASALIFRKQIRLVQQYTNKRLLGLTHDQAKQAIQVSVKDTVSLAKAMEQRFRGVSQPLAIETQGWMDRATRGTNASLLQQHRTSVGRYGDRMILDFERQLRVGLLTGMSHHEIVSRLVDTGKLGGIKAAGLHRNDPRWFPKPTSYVKKRYWAERIVRTEMAYAANAANLSAMHGMKDQFPDMGKKILATFDAKTALDSIAVHGQVRRLEEYFMDGAGRQYLHPPARPLDRETIVPWRMGWKELPATEPEQKDPTPKPVVPPKGPEASPNSLFDDIMDTNAKVKAKKAEQAAAQAKVEQGTKQTAALVKQTAQQLKEAQAAQAAAIAKAKAAEAAAIAKAKTAQAKAEKLAQKQAAVEAKTKADLEKAAAIEAAKIKKLAEAKAKAEAVAKAKAAKLEAARLAKEAKATKGPKADGHMAAARKAWKEAKTREARQEVLAAIPERVLPHVRDTRNWDGTPRGDLTMKSLDVMNQLRRDELSAIQAFTGSAFDQIRDDEAKGRGNKFSTAIQAGMKSVHVRPVEDVVVWRGMHDIPDKAFDQWLGGKEFRLGKMGKQGTTSTSHDQMKAAITFAEILPSDKDEWDDDGRADKNKILFKLRNKRGIPIETFSLFPEEREVLQPKDAKFRVLSVTRVKGMQHTFVIEAEGVE